MIKVGTSYSSSNVEGKAEPCKDDMKAQIPIAPVNHYQLEKYHGDHSII
jgi:hypothetical protein